MRVIEDAIADPGLGIVDFGQGDAAYKQQFSSESRLERELVVFAPTFRGRWRQRDPDADRRLGAPCPPRPRRRRADRPRPVHLAPPPRSNVPSSR